MMRQCPSMLNPGKAVTGALSEKVACDLRLPKPSSVLVDTSRCSVLCVLNLPETVGLEGSARFSLYVAELIMCFLAVTTCASWQTF